jgi:hypothetical protein
MPIRIILSLRRQCHQNVRQIVTVHRHIHWLIYALVTTPELIAVLRIRIRKDPYYFLGSVSGIRIHKLL